MEVGVDGGVATVEDGAVVVVVAEVVVTKSPAVVVVVTMEVGFNISFFSK